MLQTTSTANHKSKEGADGMPAPASTNYDKCTDRADCVLVPTSTDNQRARYGDSPLDPPALTCDAPVDP